MLGWQFRARRQRVVESFIDLTRHAVVRQVEPVPACLLFPVNGGVAGGPRLSPLPLPFFCPSNPAAKSCALYNMRVLAFTEITGRHPGTISHSGETAVDRVVDDSFGAEFSSVLGSVTMLLISARSACSPHLVLRMTSSDRP